MFSVTFQVNKKYIAIAAVALVLAFAGGIWLQSAKTDLKVSSAVNQSESKPPKIGKAAGDTREERIAFLESFGWKVQGEEIEIEEVLIPNEFDDVYVRYNEIQKDQGADLQKYAGKQCKRYSYVVENHPEAERNVRANILVYNGKIVGGDICSLELDGFMHGFVLQQ